MAGSITDVKSIFGKALEIASPAEREAYLAEACGGDPRVRAEVETLLRAGEAAEGFLDGLRPHLAPTIDLPPSEEAPGAVIGPYKLVEPIGEGGMGAVWMAQQTEPVRRLVAVKLIKAGMDSKQVIARFEAERQALALMDHPNIARVLDGGTTDAGRPYFVMDLVKGVSITRYCDDHRLTPRQRLELFVPVCQAVQHAHQKGIIHRDIKPSNVLVALYDGRPVPKVIDFGVAKAAGQPLTEQTLVTGFGAIVGTLEYMSPEQAEVNQLDVDTRSDIYSLGVLLYELLTGTTPLERKRVKESGLLEALRIIREEETPTLSNRLSTSGELPAIAANRGTEPAKLAKLVRGELDWIVMKALEKDRNRRYETANGFAMDVQRYLADEPVQAGPPSAAYRLRKFVRRNRGPVVAAGVILLCLMAGIIGTSAGLVWAVRERDQKSEALTAETNAREAERQARDRAMTALRFMTDVIVENQMARGTQLTAEDKEFLRTIIKHFEGFAASTADDTESRAIRAEGNQRVGLLRDRLGELTEAEAAYRAAIALWEPLAAEFPDRPEFRANLARTHNNLGVLLRNTGRLKLAEAACAEALSINKQLADEFSERPEFHQELARTLNNRGVLFQHTGQLKEAEKAFQDAVAVRRRLADKFPKRPEFRDGLARTHNNLGYVLQTMGRLNEAEASYAEALTLQKQLADDFPERPEFRQELASTHHNRGILLRTTNRWNEAEAAYGDALVLRRQLADEYPIRPEFRRELANSLNNLGHLLWTTRRSKEAEAAYGEALALQKRLVARFRTRPDFRQDLARTHDNLGHLFRDAGRLKEAHDAYAEALDVRKRLAAEFLATPDLRHGLAGSHYNLGLVFSAMGRPDEAEAAFTDALALGKQLVAESPKLPGPQNVLACTCVELASVRLKRGDFRGAQAYLAEAAPHHDAALKANVRHPEYRQCYRSGLAALIQTNAGLGDRAGAKRAAEKLRDLGWDPPHDAYEAASGLALCIPIVRRVDRATEEERDQMVLFFGDEAVRMLRAAAAKGYKDGARMATDNDLAPLRERDDFKKLLAELKAKK